MLIMPSGVLPGNKCQLCSLLLILSVDLISAATFPTTEPGSFWYAIGAGILLAITFALIVAAVAYFCHDRCCCCCPTEQDVAKEEAKDDVEKGEKDKKVTKVSNTVTNAKSIYTSESDLSSERPDSRLGMATSAQRYRFEQEAKRREQEECNNRDEQNFEGDRNVVYECAGLAQSGELEVQNPLFNNGDNEWPHNGDMSDDHDSRIRRWNNERR